MQIKERILKIAGPRLAQFGFVYRGKPDAGAWRFSRREGGAEQYVAFEKSLHKADALRVRVATSDDLVGVEVTQLSEELERKSWWTYHDSESLDGVLCELTELAVSLGIPWLANSGGPLLQPPEQLGRVLLVKPVERAKAFAESSGLNLDRKDSLSGLEQILLNRYVEVQSPDWDLLLNAGAFLGEFIRSWLGGEWGWDPRRQTAAIIGVGGNPLGMCAPLLEVAALWSKRDRVRGLAAGYRVLRNMLRTPGAGPIEH